MFYVCSQGYMTANGFGTTKHVDRHDGEFSFDITAVNYMNYMMHKCSFGECKRLIISDISYRLQTFES